VKYVLKNWRRNQGGQIQKKRLSQWRARWWLEVKV